MTEPTWTTENVTEPDLGLSIVFTPDPLAGVEDLDAELDAIIAANDEAIVRSRNRGYDAELDRMIEMYS